MDKAIRDALARQYESGSWRRLDSGSRVALPTPVRFQSGNLVFHPDRVELYGITVVEGHTRMRQILDVLREKRASGNYVAYSGAKLAERLNVIGGENAIAEAIKSFRDTVEERLNGERIICGRTDVILSGGPGYRLASWIEVQHSKGQEKCVDTNTV